MVPAALLLTTAVIVLVSTGKKGGDVEWAVLSSQEARETVRANGRVAGSRVTPLSLMKNGIVSEIRCSAGTHAEKGDTLVVLDNREEVNRVARQRGEVAIAGLQLEKMRTATITNATEKVYEEKVREEAARRHHDRSDTLYQQGSIAEEEFDRVAQDYEIAKTRRSMAETELAAVKGPELELAEARLRQAGMLLDEAEIALSRTFLCAPSRGTVVDVRVEKGELAVSGNGLLLFLPSDTAVYIEVQVDEGEIGRVRAGQKARVRTVGSTPVVLDAVVRNVIGKIDVERGSGTVILSVQSKNALIADQTVSAQIITGILPDAVVVEQRFRQSDSDGDFIFVKKEDRALRKNVRLDAIGSGRLVVRDGLGAGDTVLAAADLKDGMKVRLSRK